jgi:ABC-2 type transport system permease protein
VAEPISRNASAPWIAPAGIAGARPRAGGPPTAREQLRSFMGLLERDARVQVRNIGQFIGRVVLSPLLITFVFAFLLPRIGQPLMGAGRAGYGTVLVPGLVALSILGTGVTGAALPLAMEYLRHEMDDRLLAPLPIWAIGIEKILAGAVQALLAGLIVFPIAYFVPASSVAVQVDQWWLLVAVLLLTGLVAGAVGLLLGCLVGPEQFGLLFGVLLTPLLFLGCVYYPWSLLGQFRWLQVGVLVNPLVYMSEGLRAQLTPSVPHMPAWAYFGGLVFWLVVFSLAGLRLFMRRATS